MTDNYKITNEDCLIGLKKIKDDSINLNEILLLSNDKTDLAFSLLYP